MDRPVDAARAGGGEAHLETTVHERFEKIVRRIDKVELRLDGHHDILVKIAEQEARLDGQDKRMDGFDDRIAALSGEIGRLRLFCVQTNNRTIEAR